MKSNLPKGYKMKCNGIAEDGTFCVFIKKDGELVATADFIVRNGYIEPFEQGMEAVLVEPEHRRKGLATAMYIFAEEFSGLPVRPSKEQSVDGAKFWSQPRRQFGKK